MVLAHFARGKSNAGIAEALGVGRVTVRNAIYRVLDKLGLESNRETLVWAEQNGLLEGKEGQGAVGPGSLGLEQRHPSWEDQAPHRAARVLSKRRRCS